MSKKIKMLIVTFVLLAVFAMSVSAAGGNISQNAVITASSEYSDNYAGIKCAHEYEAEHDQGTEWASAGEMTPWIKFEYPGGVWINKIILSDRSNTADWSKIVEISFSDGSKIVTPELDDFGEPHTVNFDPKHITWVQFDVIEYGDATLNNGLGRVSIYDVDPPAGGATATADVNGISFIKEAATGERDNYNGSVGYEFECLVDIVVSTVGRPLNGVMNNPHKIYIWEVATETLLATAEVKPDSPLDSLGFKTAPLNTTLNLKAGEKYRIVSAEEDGGDAWYDIGVQPEDMPELLVNETHCIMTSTAFTGSGDHDSYPSNQYNVPGPNKGYTGLTFYYTVAGAEAPAAPAVQIPAVIDETASGGGEAADAEVAAVIAAPAPVVAAAPAPAPKTGVNIIFILMVLSLASLAFITMRVSRRYNNT